MFVLTSFSNISILIVVHLDFFSSSLVNISISFLMFELWLLRILRFSWMYFFESHLFLCYACSRTAFFGAALLKEQIGAHRQQSVFSWGSRDRCLLGKYPFLSSFCQRGTSSFKAICRTVLKSKLDRGSPCLVPFFLISNMSLSSSVITAAFPVFA